ncbi:MAG: hypothetical protein AB8B61_02105 [Cyclobacteriaceae bacterium]
MKRILLQFIFLMSLYCVSAQPINESSEELFKWGMPLEINNSSVSVTKPMQGYVVTVDKERIEGILKLKKVDDVLTIINIKAKKKLKFQVSEIYSYGALSKISDVTNDGKNKFSDDAKNFYEATVFFKDNTNKTGWLAFQKAQRIDPTKLNGGFIYKGFYFTENKEEYLTSFSYDEIKQITHNNINYSPFKRGFISNEGNLNNEIELFQQGVVSLKNGAIIKGEVRQQKVLTKWYSDTILVKDVSGTVNSYSTDKVKSFTQVIDNEEKSYLSIKEFFVEKLYDGKNYMLYRNPYPSENKLLSFTAQVATVSATTVAANESAQRKFEKDAKGAKDFDQLGDAYEGAVKRQDDILEEGYGMSDNIQVNKKEYVVKMKTTQEEQVLSKKSYKKWLQYQTKICSELKDQPLMNNLFDKVSVIDAVTKVDKCN